MKKIIDLSKLNRLKLYHKILLIIFIVWFFYKAGYALGKLFAILNR